MSFYLAIDIGASSGRHILGTAENGKLKLEEIHRFKNGMVKQNSHLCWDVKRLSEEILTGISKCKEIGKIPESIGIDTWGVDFVLLDKDGQMLGDTVAYRDGRTDGMDQALSEFISERDLYARTGIQKQLFNTIYQFMSLKKRNPGLLEQANGFLMIPEYFSYLLTDVRRHEYTNATTTGLVNAESKNWDYDLIERIGLPRELFGEIDPPGTKTGKLLPEICGRVGFSCDVVFPCTHDTGSAVVSAPVDENSIYLSSGTWSLMGTELKAPVCTEDSRKANLTNEGGFQYRYRYLKNIMGLWIIQSIKEELGGKYSFNDLCDAAEKSSDFPSRIDVNEHRFLSPSSMIDEITAACVDSGQKAPEGTGEMMFCVYQSLADSYAQTVRELEAITEKTFDRVCIIGGGSKDSYLNELTAKTCGKKVSAGPTEGTAIGNILVQMMSAGSLKGIDEARELVKQSFTITEY